MIKTEPDLRRADRYNDDTLIPSGDKEVIDPKEPITASVSWHRRVQARESSGATTALAPFPFLELPPETREQILQYLLVSKSTHAIALDLTGYIFESGGIETAVLLANRQVGTPLSEHLRILTRAHRRCTVKLSVSSTSRTVSSSGTT